MVVSVIVTVATTTTAAALTAIGGGLGVISVIVLIMLLIGKELSSAHSEERADERSGTLARFLTAPIVPLLITFAFIVAVKVLEVL